MTLVATVAVALCIATTGCIPKRAIYVRMTDRVELAPSMGGHVAIKAEVIVENHNPRSLRLTEAKFFSWYAGSDLATITLESPVEIRAKRTDTVWLPLDARFVSAGRMITFALQGGVEDWQNVEVEGYAKVRYGVSGKKVRVARKKLKELSNF